MGRDIGNKREDETCKDMEIVKADVQGTNFVKADTDVDIMKVDRQGCGLCQGRRRHGLCEGRHASMWTSLRRALMWTL